MRPAFAPCWLAITLTLLLGSPIRAQDEAWELRRDVVVTQQAAWALFDADSSYAEASPTAEPARGATAEETPDAPLQGRLGSSREAFEDDYGTPVGTEAGNEPASFMYEGPGFDAVEVAYHRDFVRYITLDLATPVEIESATEIVAPFVPADFVMGATPVETESGDILTVGTSAALRRRFSAMSYERYGASGKQGDLFYLFRLNAGGQVISIEVGLGDHAPGGAMDAAAYLTAAQAQYDAVIGSMGVFAALIGAPPDQPTDVYRDALIAEAATWQQAYDEAIILTPPPELEGLHASYLQFARLMNEAANHIVAGITEDNPDLIDDGINQVIEATALIKDLDRAFAEAEEQASDSFSQDLPRRPECDGTHGRHCSGRRGETRRA